MSNNKIKSQYDDAKFHEWLAERKWVHYGPQMSDNPLATSIPETYVFQGEGRARHKSAADLYKQYQEEQAAPPKAAAQKKAKPAKKSAPIKKKTAKKKR